MSEDVNKSVHLWNHCHQCDASPIVGLRYQCRSCPDGPDNDLCETCYELYQKGVVSHPAQDSYASGIGIAEHRFEVFEGKPLHLFLDWLQVEHPAAAAPSFPERFVIRPLFSADTDTVIGGYGFAASIDGTVPPLMLTALHVMDEIIKNKGIDCSENNKNYTGRELPAVITEVNLFDLFADNWMTAPLGNAGPMLVLPGAGTGDEEPYSYRDIAAFWVHAQDAGKMNPVPLASTAPRVGEPVWLVAGAPENPQDRIHKAVVVEINEKSLIFKYEDNREKPKYSSGAPVLDRNGEIAGINVGGGRLERQRLGHANHVGNIRKHLEEHTHK
jgi:hypothetical protein